MGKLLRYTLFSTLFFSFYSIFLRVTLLCILLGSVNTQPSGLRTAQTVPSSRQTRGCHFPDLQMRRLSLRKEEQTHSLTLAATTGQCCFSTVPISPAHFPPQTESKSQTERNVLTQSDLSICEKVYSACLSMLPEAHRLRVFLDSTFKARLLRSKLFAC